MQSQNPAPDVTDTQPHAPKAMRRVAEAVVAFPKVVVLLFVILGGLATLAASKLTINSNQLDLINQDLRQVKDVKRVIDMVGGSGFLMLALRSDDEVAMKKVADDIAHELQADTNNVRQVTFRTPVEFVQRNIGLFVKTEDLKEFKRRFDLHLKAQMRQNNPFFVRLHDAKPPTLEVQDLVDKYSHVGKKTLLDDYYLSNDRKMLLLLIKPRWDSNELGQTHAFVETLRQRLDAYSRAHPNGVQLVEDYRRMGDSHTVAYGFTGGYKTALDDSFAIKESLEPVSLWAFFAIVGITSLFFRKWVPTLIVMTGMVLGTVLTLGFCWLSVGQLNMITSILGGILMGFGVDYGIHFIFRTRIELGQDKPVAQAVIDALINAGRPALVAAIVTGGSFMVLMFSEFKGFSQFGFLAGVGTLLIGATMFLWSAAWVVLLGRWYPKNIVTMLGRMNVKDDNDAASAVKRPYRLLVICLVSVASVCAFAVPAPAVVQRFVGPTWSNAFLKGVRFNYNTRALMAEDQYSVQLQDEINRRFSISSDPVAVYSKDLDEALDVYRALNEHKEQYQSIDQVMSIYTFVPEKAQAVANASIMHAWHDELLDIDANIFKDDALRNNFARFKQALLATPYDVKDVPEVYQRQFFSLPEARPENKGILTFIYPRVDLWDGQQMLRFADEIDTIVGTHGRTYHAAGSPLLYAHLARVVLRDGRLTLVLAAIWILAMHLWDFRSLTLALASVLPLCLGLGMMLGLMDLTQHPLNFMNIIMLPILLGFGVSHGLYLLHRFLEGIKTSVALKSVGAAVVASTLTAMAGFASLFAASHQGLKSMGYVACLGLMTTLVISFTVLAAVLQIIENRRGIK